MGAFVCSRSTLLTNRSTRSYENMLRRLQVLWLAERARLRRERGVASLHVGARCEGAGNVSRGRPGRRAVLAGAVEFLARCRAGPPGGPDAGPSLDAMRESGPVSHSLTHLGLLNAATYNGLGLSWRAVLSDECRGSREPGSLTFCWRRVVMVHGVC